MASPKVLNYATRSPTMARLQQGFMTSEMGLNDHFALQKY